MNKYFTTFAKSLLIPATILLLSSPLQAKDKGGFEASIVPGDTPTFTNGEIEIKAKDGELKFTLNDVEFPVGTPGNLVITLMVNDSDEEDLVFPFAVREKDDDDDRDRPNFVKVKASLQKTLDIEVGSTLKLLGVRVEIDGETVSSSFGFTLQKGKRRGNDGRGRGDDDDRTDGTTVATTGSIKVKCEVRSDRSKISVDGNNLNPSDGPFTAMVQSGQNQLASAVAMNATGDEVEFDFDSDRGDIDEGATAIASNFIQGNEVTGEILNTSGGTVAMATVRCKVKT